jgi:hypothetical protein
MKKEYEKMKDILTEFEGAIKKVTEEIVIEAKNNCETYGEVKKKLDFLKRQFVYEREGLMKYSYVFKVVEDILAKEMNELLVPPYSIDGV